MARKQLGKRIVRSSLFAHLLARAARYIRDPDRLTELWRKASIKAESTRGSGPLKEARDTLLTFLRLVRAYGKGDYRQLPSKTLLTIVAAVLYFLMPVDIIPDFVLGIGYVDDVAVLAWVMSAVTAEIQAFRQWESSQPAQGAAGDR